MKFIIFIVIIFNLLFAQSFEQIIDYKKLDSLQIKTNILPDHFYCFNDNYYFICNDDYSLNSFDQNGNFIEKKLLNKHLDSYKNLNINCQYYDVIAETENNLLVIVIFNEVSIFVYDKKGNYIRTLKLNDKYEKMHVLEHKIMWQHFGLRKNLIYYDDKKIILPTYEYSFGNDIEEYQHSPLLVEYDISDFQKTYKIKKGYFMNDSSFFMKNIGFKSGRHELFFENNNIYKFSSFLPSIHVSDLQGNELYKFGLDTLYNGNYKTQEKINSNMYGWTMFGKNLIFQNVNYPFPKDSKVESYKPIGNKQVIPSGKPNIRIFNTENNKLKLLYEGEFPQEFANNFRYWKENIWLNYFITEENKLIIKKYKIQIHD
jgi:hypothetical protein